MALYKSELLLFIIIIIITISLQFCCKHVTLTLV